MTYVTASLSHPIHNGFALHEVVVDSEGKPVDYLFLEIDDAFEAMAGFRCEDVVGKRVADVLPGIEKDFAGWIGRYGKVVVNDTGKGIAPETMKKRFPPFSRLAGAGEGKEKGTGLGLYLPAKILDQPDGTIGIRSEPGEGFRLVLTLPSPAEILPDPSPALTVHDAAA